MNNPNELRKSVAELFGAKEVKFNSYIEVTFENGDIYTYDLIYSVDNGFFLQHEKDKEIRELHLFDFKLEAHYKDGSFPKIVPEMLDLFADKKKILEVKKVVVKDCKSKLLGSLSLCGTLLVYDFKMAEAFGLNVEKAVDFANHRSEVDPTTYKRK